ncbi:MAG: hypothetical protein MUC50_02955 [Myxococcota bacterium]|jgi:hypothetical protein|nr:hypothetical protein [Myxococcota bacterium]
MRITHFLCAVLPHLFVAALASNARAQSPGDIPKHPERDWAVRAGGHVAAFSAGSDRTADPSFGYGLEASLRFRSLGLVAEVGQHLWPSLEVDWDVAPGVLYAALGGEFLYSGGRLRSSLAVGASILLYDTGFGDGPGSTGPFIHLVPIAVRVPFGHYLTGEIRPLSWIWAAPVLREHRHLLRNDIVFSIVLEVGS